MYVYVHVHMHGHVRVCVYVCAGVLAHVGKGGGQSFINDRKSSSVVFRLKLFEASVWSSRTDQTG